MCFDKYFCDTVRICLFQAFIKLKIWCYHIFWGMTELMKLGKKCGVNFVILISYIF